MRAWTKSACVVLAWIILSFMLVAVGMNESVHPAQANTRTASSTEVTLTSAFSVAAAPTTTSPPARYVVQPGDTLSGIAARFSVRGGWPALYAANRQVIGADPNVIRPATVLVLPGQMVPVRYTVAAGDTLSGIAAQFAVRGGWPALYAANRSLIGPDPNAIQPGTVLKVPSPTAPSPPTRRPTHGRPHPAPPSRPAGHRHHPRSVARKAPAATGMPHWLMIMLLAVGLLILVAFIAEPVLAAGGRRRRAAIQALHKAELDQKPAPRQLDAAKPRIILADHDRLVVTRNNRDNTVCVLRRPDEDPITILRVARLVMPEGPYEELAEQLGLPASWPMQ